MIFVNRVKRPDVLTNNAASWTADYLYALDQLNFNQNDPSLKKAKKAAERKYKHPSLRESLAEKMFYEKCAYCEAYTGHNQDGAIEHYKPKSLYPELCFEWKNLLWACNRCNGRSYKGNKFPTKAEGGPILNPTVDQPERHLKFIYDEHTGTALVETRTKRGQLTLDLIGLNRRRLARHRRNLIEKIFHLATNAAEGDPTARILVQRSCHADSEYAAFARSIADRFGIDWKSQN